MGYLAIDFVAFSHGAGVHQWNVRLSDVEVFAQVSLAIDLWRFVTEKIRL